MTVSAVRPSGHFNDWPVGDKNAFVELLRITYAAMDEAAGPAGAVAAAHDAANAVGLEAGEHHWMVDDLLGGVFESFFLRSGDYYADARGMLTWASAEDLARLGPEAVAWARRLAGAEADH